MKSSRTGRTFRLRVSRVSASSSRLGLSVFLEGAGLTSPRDFAGGLGVKIVGRLLRPKATQEFLPRIPRHLLGKAGLEVSTLRLLVVREGCGIATRCRRNKPRPADILQNQRFNPMFLNQTPTDFAKTPLPTPRNEWVTAVSRAEVTDRLRRSPFSRRFRTHSNQPRFYILGEITHFPLCRASPLAFCVLWRQDSSCSGPCRRGRPAGAAVRAAGTAEGNASKPRMIAKKQGKRIGSGRFWFF